MYIADLTVVASALPVLVGFSRGAIREHDGRPLLIWVTIMAVESVCTTFVSIQHIGTWWITWSAYPVTLWLGLTAMLAFEVMAPFRRLRWPLFSAFLAVWLLGVFLRERETGFSNYAAPVHSIILAAVGVALLVRSGTHPLARQQRRSALAGLATALTYGPFVAIWPLSSLLSSSHPTWVLPIWETRAVLLIVGSILFCLAFWSPAPETTRDGVPMNASA